MSAWKCDYSFLINQIISSPLSLVIAFEDSELINDLTANMVSSKVELITKADINGKGVIELLKLIRRKKYSLVVVSNRYAKINRTRASLELLSFFSYAKEIFILYNEDEIYHYNKIGIFKVIAPKILLGFIYGVYSYFKFFLYLFYYDLKFRKKIKKQTNDRRTILFLRTDLAGKTLAGGSVAHIVGFISGVKELNFSVIYCSDYPLLNQPISLIIRPSKYLEIFDEFQLIQYNFKLIKVLKSIFKDKPPSLIYHRYSIFVAAGIILGYFFRVPVVIEMNHSEVWVKKNWSRLVLEKIAKICEKFVVKHADIISVVSEVTKDEIVKIGADENKIVINPNGVDPQKFSPEIDGSQIRKELNLENFFVVGFIGTFTRWHGVETLFDAAVKVIEKNGRIKFLLIGDGNLKVNLELKTHQLGLDDKIIFTGLIPHDKAPEYLAACDVLVSPHLGFEDGTRFFGSPTKLFEYMAMGKPIIASDLEQIGKIIIDGENGLKFKPGDVEKLTELILKLYDDEFLRTKLGKKAREDVIKNYTWKQNAYRVLSKVFDQLSIS